MTIQTYAQNKPYLFWSTNNIAHLSDEAVVEGILERGDFDDVQKIIKIMGINKVSKIFFHLTGKKRNNLSPKTINYFKLYFNKYASRNS
jgi:hypothetical protein